MIFRYLDTCPTQCKPDVSITLLPRGQHEPTPDKRTQGRILVVIHE